MNPTLKLKQIENEFNSLREKHKDEDIQWLISRVWTLTFHIKQITTHNYDHSKIEAARKALEIDE